MYFRIMTYFNYTSGPTKLMYSIKMFKITKNAVYDERCEWFASIL